MATFAATLASLLGGLVVVLLSNVLVKGWKARQFFVELAKNGQPVPPHSLLLGHLLYLKPYVDKLPLDAHGFIAFGQMARKFCGGIFYLDMWPFIGPLMICTSATAATQATQKTALAARKPTSLYVWFYSVAGGPNLFTMSEEEWRPWRNIFNPGFSQSHLNNLVPDVVKETQGYRQVLAECAKSGQMFLLDETTLWFTMDLIGSIVLETHMDSRKTRNPLATAFLSQLRWKRSEQGLNPFVRFNPIRPMVEWHNSRQMNGYIGAELDKRYDSYLADLKSGTTESSKSVIGLVLAGYQEQNAGVKPPSKLDKTFRAYATYQIRTFLFAGHDTTSTTICYIFYCLSKSPTAMDKLRHELDSVLGEDCKASAGLIADNPQLLSKLAYTLAVIKESMRLFPPASGIREGVEGVSITDDDGREYPTGNTMVWILHQAMQRSPDYWNQPNDFIPERWLVGPEDPLCPVKGAWRPFEYGPRNCIGQGLVLMELKVILAMTVREFDVHDAYEEFDQLHPPTGLKTVDGERAYQIEQGGAHPADRFPCRVSLRT